MTRDSSSDKDLLIADLQRRLAEAEETLRAIRENEVDALVMRGHLDDEIFTIGGDPQVLQGIHGSHGARSCCA